MVIAKFGGTSVGTSDALRRVAGILQREHRRTGAVAVVSALSGVTDALLAATRHAASGDRAEADALVADLRRRHAAILSELAGPVARDAAAVELDAIWARLTALLRRAEAERSCPPARSDAIVSSGELASSRIIVDVLRHANVPAVFVDARRVIVTDESFTAAVPDLAATERLARRALTPILAARRVPVVGGFIGATPTGATTTLGRGGSDWTASILGASLAAREIQIWSDVDGVYSADPRTSARARHLARLSFREAERLARDGAKVLHPETMVPAEGAGIPIRVLNTFNPDAAGTLITAESHAGERAERSSAPLWTPLLGAQGSEVGA